MSAENLTSEQRRAHRIAADFWVMVQGVDASLVARRGNVSTSGIIFIAHDLHLDVGSLEYLHVVSQDRRHGVVVMAQVARIVDLPNPSGAPPQRAIAFEFMPENQERQAEVVRMVRHIAALQVQPPPVQPPPAQAAQVFALQVQHLVVETSWPVEVGDKIQLAFQSSRGGTRIPFEGVVHAVRSACAPGVPPKFIVETGGLSAGQRGAAVMHGSITESLDIVMAQIVSATADLLQERPQLKGQLNRISLASLLSWFDMSRMSGRMALSGPKDEQVTLYLSEGALVDAHASGDHEPREVVRTVLSWTEGRFELHEGPVRRADRIHTSMTALLLDLAREADESSGDMSFVA